MYSPPFICNLADVRLIFSPFPSGSLTPFFSLFPDPGGEASTTCRIELAGDSSDLSLMQIKGAWHFELSDGRACLMGANPEGAVMWRMTGEVPYEQLRFEWHPTAFEDMYHSVAYGMYNIVAILALVLRLLPLGGLVLHGSAQIVDGKGVICTGPSGKGKSTISRLFDRCGVPVLTDEHPLVRPATDGFRVYGSPWPSSGRFALNASAPLRKIYFIEHGPEQEILPLTAREAVLRLLDVAMVPWLDQAFFDPMIRTLEAVLREVPHALLRFRPDATVVDAVRRDLSAF
jgi:hypothetical protein